MPIPIWEMLTATFDTEYMDSKKGENINITTITAREHVDNKYHDHLHIFMEIQF